MMAVERGAAFSRASSSLTQCGAGRWCQRTHSQRATIQTTTRTEPAVAKSTTMTYSFLFWFRSADSTPSGASGLHVTVATAGAGLVLEDTTADSTIGSVIGC